MTDVFSPMTFKRGPAMKNRFMLAPLTNHQSHEDGTLSDEEFKWLTMRAQGGFGMTMTCAAHVQEIGKGWPGQLGVWSDDHIPGLTRFAKAINQEGSVSVVQIHHAGLRSPEQIIGTKSVGPSDDEESDSRALSTGEVEQLREDFIAGALRCEKAGFHGAEIHGAHGYILCAFLSPELNLRTDQYGGSYENRTRLICEIIEGIRARANPEFNLGIRLSPERFGLRLDEIVRFAEELMTGGNIDYLDMSLWDCFKVMDIEEYKGQRLIDIFARLERGETRLAAAGKLRTPEDVNRAMDGGLDFVSVGRGGIIHHDFPELMKADPKWLPLPNPVSEAHLADEGLSPVFIKYMRNWKGFVEEPVDPEAEVAKEVS